MKLVLVAVFMVGGSAVGAGPFRVQEPDQERDLEQVKKQLADLEKKIGEKALDRQLPDWLDRFSFEGIAFLRYSYEFAEAQKDFNEFDIDRLYLTVASKLWDKGRVRYTLEGGDLRENGTDEFEVVTKDFHLEVQDILLGGDFFRAGQTGLPWNSHEEGVWGYRFQGTIFADRSGYLTSTDLGISYGGKIPDGYGSWQANLVNGEGWKKNETGKRKDAHLRMTFYPFAGTDGFLKNFFLTGLGVLGTYEDDATVSAGEPDDRDRLIAMAGYKEEGKLALAAEWLTADDPADKLKSKHPSLAARPNEKSEARGHSVFGTLNLSTVFGEEECTKKWELIGRWDRLDPDDQIDHNELDRYIFGISHRWNKHVRTLLDWERVHYETGALKDDERRLMLQTEIRF